ncbi:MAG: TrbI/VirB10 family protein [Caulobacteraceae bacterium]|nr:TrbI/VirB10 family protein [Caulobacteraceae bacterium]
MVIDTTPGGATGAPTAAAGQNASDQAAAAEGPVRAARLTRRATTVQQGTLIPAVLETALDSTRPGHVRAIVSRDITGFDGRQVLIPRGTRLFGEYEADLNAGQNRAFVQWTRLVRPDGVTIALASPAADVQGRAGIQGKVNSHFLERFGAAFLQSTLNFGMGLAGRSLTGDNGVVVALPGAVQSSGATSVGGGSQIRPTLRVDAGVRVTVFVARDLEFPSGETRR